MKVTVKRTIPILLAILIPASRGWAQFKDGFLYQELFKRNLLEMIDATIENPLQDLYETTDPVLQRGALATAAMIPKELIHTDEGSTNATIGSRGRGRIRFCPLERFFQYHGQKSSATCSGFLIGSDLLMTAGHCYGENPEEKCASHAWLFDYAVKSPTDDPYTTTSDNIYHCQKVVHIVDEGPVPSGRDVALVRLDRPVEGRAPLRVNSNGAVTNDARLVAIGFPGGLPLKITSVGTVTERDSFYFYADLDVFPGNSGGPVINVDTGLVKGIASSFGNKHNVIQYSSMGCYNVDAERDPGILSIGVGMFISHGQ